MIENSLNNHQSLLTHENTSNTHTDLSLNNNPVSNQYINKKPTKDLTKSISWISNNYDSQYDTSSKLINITTPSKTHRTDSNGHPILKGLSKHHVSFIDSVKTKQKAKLAEIIHIESFKPYNNITKPSIKYLDITEIDSDYSDKDDRKSNCCILF